jgi:hypothetical protein
MIGGIVHCGKTKQFDMAASLRKLGKSETPQNIHNILSG